MTNGGARPGAGRPPKPKRAVKKVMAEAILSSINELEAWQDLLSATTITSVVVIAGGEGERESMTVPDYNIRFKALSYLTNRRDGMPPQSVNVTEERDLDFGNIPAPEYQSRTAHQPN